MNELTHLRMAGNMYECIGEAPAPMPEPEYADGSQACFVDGKPAYWQNGKMYVLDAELSRPLVIKWDKIHSATPLENEQ